MADKVPEDPFPRNQLGTQPLSPVLGRIAYDLVISIPSLHTLKTISLPVTVTLVNLQFLPFQNGEVVRPFSFPFREHQRIVRTGRNSAGQQRRQTRISRVHLVG